MKLDRLVTLIATFVLILAGCATTPGAGAPDRMSARDGMPPLLDRKLFFDDPEISGAQVSPDGRYISFRKPYEGVMNIWVKGVDEPFESARPITADKDRPVTGYFWTEDSRYVLYVQDKGGDEDYHVYAVDPGAAAEPSTGVPPARDLTPYDGIRATIVAVPEGTPGEIIVGMNDRDPSLHDLYRVDIDSGERTLIFRNDENIGGYSLDLEGNVRLATRQTADGGTEFIRVVDGALGEVIYGCSWEESCSPSRFHKDGRHVYVVSNRETNLSELLLMDAETGEVSLVESDPAGEVDFGGPIFSDRTEELIGTVYVGDRLRIYPKNADFEQMLADVRSKLPDGELGFTGRTEDDRYWIVRVGRDVNPGSYYLYDARGGDVSKLYDSRPDLPEEYLAEMMPIRYTARDGTEIPAYLTIPRGVEARNLPVVIQPHGGPWARDYWGYDALAQFLANRGYAVLQMNFRGSAGYGKDFLNAGNFGWGTGVMQHDITDGVQYLIDEGIADPDRVGIMGGSYGGYATLAGVTYTPDLYAAGVSIVGPSNLITLLNSIPPYWNTFRKFFTLRMGDPDDPEQLELMKAQSPFFHATRIEAPLLIIQGANDPRVKKAESDQIVIALRDLGREVEYMVAPDEGHGFRGRENRLAMYARIERFLAEHLGGRYQEGMEPEIATRLADLTVDVADVEMPKLASGLDRAKTSPLPVPDPDLIEPVELRYQTELSIGGNQMTIESMRQITIEEGERVRVESSSKTPMGEVSDVWVLRRDGLRPISRNVVQGPAKIEVEFADRAVSGMIQAGPQQMPVDAELDAPVFGEEGGVDLVVTALPLFEGYRDTFRTYEIGQQQRMRVWSIEVTGRERVEVPAGNFDAWRVEIEPLDGEGGGETMWVSEDPRVIVRAEANLPPAMGGGLAKTELVEMTPRK